MQVRTPTGTGTPSQANHSTFPGKTNTKPLNGSGIDQRAGSIRTSAAINVQPSFAAFLAEETVAAANGKAAVSTSPGSVAPPSPATMPRETVHVLRKGETIWQLARDRYRVDPAEILRHNGITHPERLRAGQKIRIPGGADTAIQGGEQVVASWYGRYHHGRRMANGERFDMHSPTIAHRDIPFGTRVELENPATGERAEAVVTDRGPRHPDRDIDLSYGLAEQLSLTKQGVGSLKMRVL